MGKNNSENMERLENLALQLIYLSAWDENHKREYGDRPVLRAWKGYPFEILDRLSEKGLISGSKKSKSIYLTDKGIEKARKILENIREESVMKMTDCTTKFIRQFLHEKGGNDAGDK